MTIGMIAQPLTTCTREALGEGQYHALVYGRCKIWHRNFQSDARGEYAWHWSNYAWWKALHYTHVGSPTMSESWGVYGGSDGFTGPRDAELSHWMPMPDAPGGSAP